jgi:glyoxylase-like metal-dependent hydrolase (beta-lactamase superfamily II)
MFSASSRRDFLGTLIGGAAGSAWSFRGRNGRPGLGALEAVLRAETGPAPIQATRLGDSLIELTGDGGNVVIVSGPESLVLVNGGLAERSDELLKMVAKQSGGKRIDALVNTDWHPEQTGCNETLGTRGVKILAHEFTRQYIAADHYVDWQKRSYKPAPKVAWPTETFYTTGSTTCGGERIEYGHLGQAHTDGAIYVHFPGSNVLMTGHALEVGRYPIADYTAGGWLGGLINANKALLALTNAETRLVPGEGPLQTRADLQAQLEMLTEMLARFTKLMKQGKGPDDWRTAEPTKDFDEKWGNPDLFVSTAYRGMWLHVRELGGIV